MSNIQIFKNVGILIALSLSISIANAKEVKVYRFSFDVPDAWYVDGEDGELNRYATGANEMNTPPFIMIETCVSNKNVDCSSVASEPFPYNPITQKAAYEANFKEFGCTGSTVLSIPRDNGVLEKRLVCASVGYSVFIIKHAVMAVTYAPLEKGVGVGEFLERLALSLKVK
jgi:hypothetical protein